MEGNGDLGLNRGIRGTKKGFGAKIVGKWERGGG